MENINKILYMGIGVMFMFAAILGFFQREKGINELYEKYNGDKYKCHDWIDVSSKTEDTSYMNGKEIKKMVYGFLTQNMENNKKEVIINGMIINKKNMNKEVDKIIEDKEYDFEWDIKEDGFIINAKGQE